MDMIGARLDAQGMDLERTLSCAQAFRWRRLDGAGSIYCGGWFGVAGDRPLTIEQRGDELLLSDEDAAFWRHYFALDRDYAQLDELFERDEALRPCLEYARGIRVLRQQPFETLITFIVSQNNNAGRIAKTVEALCCAYGEAGVYGGREYHAFPVPQRLAEAPEDELKALGLGYRAAYVRAAAQQVARGYDLDALRGLPFDEAMAQLQCFEGVGPKVAQCVLLFSLGFDEAFPADVWIKRIASQLCGCEGERAARQLADRFGQWGGAAQQYLFHYARMTKLGK